MTSILSMLSHYGLALNVSFDVAIILTGSAKYYVVL